MTRFPVTIRGPLSRSERMAAKNLALIMGLTTSRPVVVAWSQTATPGLMTLYRNPVFEADVNQLSRDLAYCRQWPTSEASGSCFAVDVLSWIMWFTERRGEVGGPLDVHGRFDSSSSWWSEPGVAHTPVLDVMAQALRSFLERGLAALEIDTFRESPWPEGKSFAVALSHDIDDARRNSLPAAFRMFAAAGVASIRGDSHVARKRLVDALGLLPGGKTPSPYWLMPTMARMEQSRGFFSTYFVLPHTSRRVREGAYLVDRYDVTRRNVRRLLRELVRLGHELGLHTTYDAHSTIDGLSMDLSVLKSAIGDAAEVRGARSHYLRMTAQTHELTVGAGLQWDATLGYASGWGFRSGTSHPHQIDAGAATDNLWIVGLNLMDVALPREAILCEVSHLIREVAEVGGVASILIHPNPYGNGTALEHLDLYHSVLDEVAAYGDSVWVATTSEIVAACRSFSQTVCPDQ